MAEAEVAADGGGVGGEEFGAFLDCESAEEAEFDEAGGLGGGIGEAGEGGVETEEEGEAFGVEIGDGLGGGEGGVEAVVAALGEAGAGAIDEDLAHEAGDEGEEVGAAID